MCIYISLLETFYFPIVNWNSEQFHERMDLGLSLDWLTQEFCARMPLLVWTEWVRQQGLCPGWGPWERLCVGHSSYPRKVINGQVGSLNGNSQVGSSKRVQNKLEMWIAIVESDHRVPGLSFTVGLGQPWLLHINHCRAKGGSGPKAAFDHKPLFFSAKDVTKTMCRLIGFLIGFQKRSVIDWVIIASAKVVFVKV